MTEKRGGKCRRKPSPCTMQRFGILNPWGEFWTPSTFSTVDEAKKYVTDFWRDNKNVDPTKFKVVPVSVTVAAL